MPVPDEPDTSQSDQGGADDPSQHTGWDNLAQRRCREDRKADRQCMAERQRRKCAPHRPAPALLQSEGDGEEPSHTRIDAVPRSESRECKP
jgi:hypothetical protein